MKKYEIALNVDGTISKCKIVNEEEYKSSLKNNEKIVYEKEQEKRELLNHIQNLENEIELLKQEIKVLKGEDENEEE